MARWHGGGQIQDGGEWAPVRARVVARWTPGAFAENVAVDNYGTVFASVHGLGRIDSYDPATGAMKVFASLPAPPMGLAFDHAGVLWVSAGAFPRGPGSVWKISPAGGIELWADLPDAPFINGCAFHPDGRTLLACDSLTGRILAVDTKDRQSWRPWCAHPTLEPGSSGFVGANGIKIRDGVAWVTVSTRRLVLQIPLDAGGEAGSLSVFAQNLFGDDFAIGATGALFVTTHPENTVVRVDPSGRRTTIAGPGQGASGATACAFGRAQEDERALYVTTAGSRDMSEGSDATAPKPLRLEVSEAGA